MNQFLRIGGSIAYNLLLPVMRITAKNTERTRVLVIRGNEALLIKNIIGNGRWTLPGGGLHKNEPPVVGAARELKEETGMVFSTEAFVAAGVHKYDYRGINFRYHLFIVQDKTHQKPKPRTGELLAAEWVERDKLDNYVTGPVVATAVSYWPK